MNNDISRDYNNFINAKNAANKNENLIKNSCAQFDIENVEQNQKTINETLGFLGAMGAAQVSMNNPKKSVKTSVEEFISNPDGIKAQVEFCDTLVENGYCLEEAISTTDNVFNILADHRTYN